MTLIKAEELVVAIEQVYIKHYAKCNSQAVHDLFRAVKKKINSMNGVKTGPVAHWGWISCDERLPEEKINPITQDYYEYPVTAKFGEISDVRYYKFGDGHWWHFAQIMDERVIAWLPTPKPYDKDN